MRPRPDLAEERALWRRGYQRVAGVDEVGRGPLAGPVMAAALVLPLDLDFPWLSQVRDSKQLTAVSRARLAPLLQRAAAAVGVGGAEPEEIDRHGIVAATRLAMGRAIAQLSPPPDFLLVDALPLPEAGVPYKAIIHGDAICLSIAAASIVAKVARDLLMTKLDAQYPGYNFARHKGYPTRAHLERLERLGPSPIHRRCFAPVRRLLEAHPELGEWPGRALNLSKGRRETLGRLGEAAARAFLEQRGYTIQATNYRCPWGEIDVVAWHKETLVFVEVRTRRGDALGSPEESVTARKRQHLIAAAQHYLQEHRIAAPWRIDLVAVRADRDGAPRRISVVPNAVTEDD